MVGTWSKERRRSLGSSSESQKMRDSRSAKIEDKSAGKNHQARALNHAFYTERILTKINNRGAHRGPRIARSAQKSTPGRSDGSRTQKRSRRARRWNEDEHPPSPKAKAEHPQRSEERRTSAVPARPERPTARRDAEQEDTIWEAHTSCSPRTGSAGDKPRGGGVGGEAPAPRPGARAMGGATERAQRTERARGARRTGRAGQRAEGKGGATERAQRTARGTGAKGEAGGAGLRPVRRPANGREHRAAQGGGANGGGRRAHGGAKAESETQGGTRARAQAAGRPLGGAKRGRPKGGPTAHGRRGGRERPEERARRAGGPSPDMRPTHRRRANRQPRRDGAQRTDGGRRAGASAGAAGAHGRAGQARYTKRSPRNLQS